MVKRPGLVGFLGVLTAFVAWLVTENIAAALVIAALVALAVGGYLTNPFSWKRKLSEGAEARRRATLSEKRTKLKGYIEAYQRSSITLLATKLGLSTQVTEELIAEMKAEGTLNCRIEGDSVIFLGHPQTTTSVTSREIIKEREVVLVACRHCGANSPQAAAYCANCGAPIR